MLFFFSNAKIVYWQRQNGRGTTAEKKDEENKEMCWTKRRLFRDCNSAQLRCNAMQYERKKLDTSYQVTVAEHVCIMKEVACLPSPAPFLKKIKKRNRKTITVRILTWFRSMLSPISARSRSLRCLFDSDAEATPPDPTLLPTRFWKSMLIYINTTCYNFVCVCVCHRNQNNNSTPLVVCPQQRLS